MTIINGHLPFAQRIDNGHFVDVHEVENGLKCNCICPSCQLPLIARQGEIKEWHFAHATRKDKYKNTKEDCEFSFIVSVRMMARQLISEGVVIRLPEITIDAGKGAIEISRTVTASQDVTLTDVKIDQVFMDATVDVVGKIGDYTFVIYFEHEYRSLPSKLQKDPEDNKCGIICIKLENNLFLHGVGHVGKQYKDVLRESLALGTLKIEWIYHPRIKSGIEKIKSELKEKSETYEREQELEKVKVVHNDNEDRYKQRFIESKRSIK